MPLNVPDHRTSLPLPHNRLAYGFTLLELLVALVIIGLLAGYVAPRYFGQIGKSEVKVTRAQIESFDKALAQYRLDIGRFPSTEQGLAALTLTPPDEAKWQGPYSPKAFRLNPGVIASRESIRGACF